MAAFSLKDLLVQPVVTHSEDVNHCCVSGICIFWADLLRCGLANSEKLERWKGSIAG